MWINTVQVNHVWRRGKNGEGEEKWQRGRRRGDTWAAGTGEVKPFSHIVPGKLHGYLSRFFQWFSLFMHAAPFRNIFTFSPMPEQMSWRTVQQITVTQHLWIPMAMKLNRRCRWYSKTGCTCQYRFPIILIRAPIYTRLHAGKVPEHFRIERTFKKGQNPDTLEPNPNLHRYHFKAANWTNLSKK